MSFLEVFRHRIGEHVRSAQAEGREFEVKILALFEEFVMSTVQDLQGKIGEQGDKLSQLEADVRDLISKSGSTGGGTPASGLTISQDALDSAVATIANNNARIDALVSEVVSGPTTSPVVTPSEPSVSTPPTPPVPESPTAPAPSAPAPGP